MKIHICGKSFVSISYVVERFKILKVFESIQHHEVAPFLDFQALLPQILLDLAEISIRGFDILSLIRQTQCLKDLMKFCILAQMRHTQI